MRNWTINEAVRILTEGKDTDVIKEIVSGYPMFAMAVFKNDLAGVAALMGAEFTLDSLFEEPFEDGSNVDEGTDEDNGQKANEDKPLPNNRPLEESSVKELMKLCDDRNIKIPHFGKNKQFYIDKLLGNSAKEKPDKVQENSKAVKAASESKAANDANDNDDWGDVEEETKKDPYKGKTAKELHAMCKERGIKADIKKPAQFYADLLRKADKEQEEAEDADDWGDVEEETKKGSKPKGNTSKQASAPVDDSDDWEI